jgi:hypothetical protein
VVEKKSSTWMMNSGTSSNTDLALNLAVGAVTTVAFAESLPAK